MEAIQQQQPALPALQGKDQQTKRLFARAVAGLAKMKTLKIVDDATRDAVIDLRQKAKAGAKETEDLRVAGVKPHNDEVKLINETFKPTKSRFDDTVVLANGELLRDHKERERIAEEGRLAAQKEAARLEAEADAKAKQEAEERASEAAVTAAQEAEAEGYSRAEAQEYGDLVRADEAAKPVEAAPVPVPVAPPPPRKTTVAESGASATVKKVWTFEVVDTSLIPAEFLRVDDVGIRALMRQQVKQYGRPNPMNGIRFFQDDSVSGR